MTFLNSELAKIPARVVAGVAYLDDELPDWRDRVCENALQMQSACNCMLGQLGWEHAQPTWDWAVDNGFARPNAPSSDITGAISTQLQRDYYEALTTAWRQELKSTATTS